MVRKMEQATLAGGCFWCLEPVYQKMKGVESVVSGYTGGDTENPTYQEVCSGDTGHAEAVQITFDPEVVTFQTLLEVFFSLHNPTTLNRQGADVGTQYRSAIFYHNEEQRQHAERFIAQLESERIWQNKIVTEVTALGAFYPAEAYHQQYYAKNPFTGYCQMVVAPKLKKALAQHKELF